MKWNRSLNIHVLNWPSSRVRLHQFNSCLSLVRNIDKSIYRSAAIYVISCWILSCLLKFLWSYYSTNHITIETNGWTDGDVTVAGASPPNLPAWLNKSYYRTFAHMYIWMQSLILAIFFTLGVLKRTYSLHNFTGSITKIMFRHKDSSWYLKRDEKNLSGSVHARHISSAANSIYQITSHTLPYSLETYEKTSKKWAGTITHAHNAFYKHSVVHVYIWWRAKVTRVHVHGHNIIVKRWRHGVSWETNALCNREERLNDAPCEFGLQFIFICLNKVSDIIRSQRNNINRVFRLLTGKAFAINGRGGEEDAKYVLISRWRLTETIIITALVRCPSSSRNFIALQRLTQRYAALQDIFIGCLFVVVKCPFNHTLSNVLIYMHCKLQYCRRRISDCSYFQVMKESFNSSLHCALHKTILIFP